jgi:hypothetical protein
MTIGLAHVPGCCHQQHHGGVSDGGCVRVGAIGDRDTPASCRVEIDSFVARADGADDLELRQQIHLVGGQTAAAVGQDGPDGFACLANGVYPVCILLPLANGVAGVGERSYAFGREAHHSQDADSHARSFNKLLSYSAARSDP